MRNDHQKGYILLISVLITGAVASAIAISLLLLGTDHAQYQMVTLQGIQARQLADSCAEEALQQIRSSTSYVGSSGLTPTQGSCTYTVSNTGGENRTINSTGVSDNSTRRIQVTITAIEPAIIVSSWQEVASF